jgi:predicted MFS family arabinose efflux permease
MKRISGPLERQQTEVVGCFAAYRQFKLPPSLPVLLQRCGYDRTVAGRLMSVYALAGLLMSLPLGRAIDRRGMLRFVHLAFVTHGCRQRRVPRPSGCC